MKKIRVAYWEFVYYSVCIILFGFWVGYILGSSSWRFKPTDKDEFILQVAVIIAMMVVLYVLFRVIIQIYRMVEITKKKYEIGRKQDGYHSTFFDVRGNLIEFQQEITIHTV